MFSTTFGLRCLFLYVPYLEKKKKTRPIDSKHFYVLSRVMGRMTTPSFLLHSALRTVYRAYRCLLRFWSKLVVAVIFQVYWLLFV